MFIVAIGMASSVRVMCAKVMDSPFVGIVTTLLILKVGIQKQSNQLGVGVVEYG